MMHIATIHWKDNRWIDIQLKYLAQNISNHYKVYAFLNDIDPTHYTKFHYVIDEPIIDHGIKLNILAEIILQRATNEDWLVFIDGDAFPISNITTYLSQKFQTYPLVAIQRKENIGDPIAHPSFCATTIGFWKEIKGDWKKGFRYTNKHGFMVSDVGANLYKTLLEKKVDWYPLHRTNKTNYHPLFFGIYDHIIYHHGAGFRDSVSSVDLEKENYFNKRKKFIRLFILFLKEKRQRIVNKLRPYTRKKIKIIKRNEPVEHMMFKKITQNNEFFKEFI